MRRLTKQHSRETARQNGTRAADCHIEKKNENEGNEKNEEKTFPRKELLIRQTSLRKKQV